LNKRKKLGFIADDGELLLRIHTYSVWFGMAMYDEAP